MTDMTQSGGECGCRRHGFQKIRFPWSTLVLAWLPGEKVMSFKMKHSL